MHIDKCQLVKSRYHLLSACEETLFSLYNFVFYLCIIFWCLVLDSTYIFCCRYDLCEINSNRRELIMVDIVFPWTDTNYFFSLVEFFSKSWNNLSLSWILLSHTSLGINAECKLLFFSLDDSLTSVTDFGYIKSIGWGEITGIFQNWHGYSWRMLWITMAEYWILTNWKCIAFS